MYDAAGGPSGKILKSFPAGAAVRPLTLDPGEGHIIYQLDQFHGFKVRDVATGAVTKSVESPPLPSNVKLPESYPTPWTTVWASHPAAPSSLQRRRWRDASRSINCPITSFWAPYRSAKTRTGSSSGAIRRSRFVSNRASNTLSVVDLESVKEIKQVQVGRMPARFSVVRVPERHVAEAAD